MSSAATHSYTVPTMSCGHCKETIASALAALPDVEAIDVDLDTKTVAVTGGDPAAITTAIVDAGYPIS